MTEGGNEEATGPRGFSGFEVEDRKCTLVPKWSMVEFGAVRCDEEGGLE